MSLRKTLPIAACGILLAAMPMMFRRPVGALASAEGLRRLGEAVALLDSLHSEGHDGTPLMIILQSCGSDSSNPNP